MGASSSPRERERATASPQATALVPDPRTPRQKLWGTIWNGVWSVGMLFWLHFAQPDSPLFTVRRLAVVLGWWAFMEIGMRRRRPLNVKSWRMTEQYPVWALLIPSLLLLGAVVFEQFKAVTAPGGPHWDEAAGWIVVAFLPSALLARIVWELRNPDAGPPVADPSVVNGPDARASLGLRLFVGFGILPMFIFGLYFMGESAVESMRAPGGFSLAFWVGAVPFTVMALVLLYFFGSVALRGTVWLPKKWMDKVSAQSAKAARRD